MRFIRAFALFAALGACDAENAAHEPAPENSAALEATLTTQFAPVFDECFAAAAFGAAPELKRLRDQGINPIENNGLVVFEIGKAAAGTLVSISMDPRQKSCVATNPNLGARRVLLQFVETRIEQKGFAFKKYIGDSAGKTYLRGSTAINIRSTPIANQARVSLQATLSPRNW